MSPRPEKFHFYCDQNFPVPAGKFLRSLGHSVEFAKDHHNESLTDKDQLIYATKNKLILLTVDQDFRSYQISSEMVTRSAGLVVYQTSLPTITQHKRAMKKLLNNLSKIKIAGRICRLSVDNISYLKPSIVRE